MNNIQRSISILISIFLLFSLFYGCHECKGIDSNNNGKEEKNIEFRPVQDPKWTDRYDQYFRKYSKRFFGIGFAGIRESWLWWKSQAIAESALKKNAESWVGAKGLMQIMPATFTEIREEIDIPNSITSPRWNIAAGIYYDKKMWNIWTDPRPLKERLKFTFASYNGGAGNILKAQRLCEYKCNYWKNIKTQGNSINSWREEETIDYVNRIFVFMTPPLK